jgi:cyclopropane fatty-acyl-phospholipid synthase-like methyltransferase
MSSAGTFRSGFSEYSEALAKVADSRAQEILARANGYHMRAFFDSPEKWYWQEALRLLREHCHPQDAILDVGCGFAAFSYGLRRYGFANVFSTDIDHTALKCAEAALASCGLAPNILYEDLSEIGPRFRAVCAFDFLYSLDRERFRQMLCTMAGRLAGPGLLLFTMATPDSSLLKNPRATRLTEDEIVEDARFAGLSLVRVERRSRRIPLFSFRSGQAHHADGRPD